MFTHTFDNLTIIPRSRVGGGYITESSLLLSFSLTPPPDFRHVPPTPAHQYSRTGGPVCTAGQPSPSVQVTPCVTSVQASGYRALSVSRLRQGPPVSHIPYRQFLLLQRSKGAVIKKRDEGPGDDSAGRGACQQTRGHVFGS